MKYYFIALVVIILFFWFMTKSEKYEKTELIDYIKSTDNLNPFMVLAMVKKISSDKKIHQESLRLAKEQKSSELLRLIQSLK